MHSSGAANKSLFIIFKKAQFPSTENALLYCPDLVKSHMVFEINHSNLNNHWMGGKVKNKQQKLPNLLVKSEEL